MAAKVGFRVVAAVAAFTLLLGIYSATLWQSYESGTNFYMYYTAACLVRGRASMQIYDLVGPNTNPQLLYADPNSAFAQTARAHGISRITLYLYPPTLADMVVPFTFLSARDALRAWHLLNLLLLIGIALVLSQAFGIRFRGSAALVTAALLLYRPTLNDFHWGQVSVLLAFLITFAFVLNGRGQKIIAALLFAVAIAIKLEPVVIVIPLLAWRDWKCLRYVVIWGVVLFLALWAVNGTDAMRLYFLHQLPAMSGGELAGGGFDVNRSLGNIFYTLLAATHAIVPPRALAWIVRVVSALILCYAGWLSRPMPGHAMSSRRQVEIGVIYLLLTCCLSPYSWFYNWALSAPAMVLFFKRVWDGNAKVAESVLLVALLLSLVTTHFGMAMVSPVLGVALALVALHCMRREPSSAGHLEGALQTKLAASSELPEPT